MPVKLHNIDSSPWVCLMQLNSIAMALHVKDSLEYLYHGMSGFSFKLCEISLLFV